MPKPKPLTDINRRTFLRGAAGTSAAMVVSAAYSRDILAQEESSSFAGYTFLSPSEVPTVEALAEQIWPATDETVGGQEAGVATYIDRALSGAYTEYQPVYRLGLEWVDQAANEEHGANFADLESEQQRAFLETHLGTPDETATATPGASPGATPITVDPEGTPDNLGVEGMPLPGEAATPSGAMSEAEEDMGDGTIAGAPVLAGGDPPQITNVPDFLELVLTHTIEGLFADPAYGGNRDMAVWRDLQYGGPHYVHDEEHQTTFEPLDIPVQSLADL